MNNPYDVSHPSMEPSDGKKFFRWRILPVILFALMTCLAVLATVFDFVVLGYSLIAESTPEGWHAKFGATFLRDGLIGLLQIPLLGFGTYYLWKERYAKAALALAPALLVRTIATWLFPS